jgi:hypothetical protein
MKMQWMAASIGLCLAASAAAADVYKWKDAQGHVHYGDLSKRGAEKVKAGPANGESATPADRDKDQEAQKARHDEDCSRKRDQLATYSTAARIVEKDSLGNEKEFNEADRKKLIELTQKQIADGCAEAPKAN